MWEKDRVNHDPRNFPWTTIVTINWNMLTVEVGFKRKIWSSVLDKVNLKYLLDTQMVSQLEVSAKT
jgi:hypothetical protein